MQVHFICEKTTSTFFFVVSKTSRVARKMPSSFRFVPGMLFHNWNRIQVNQTYIPSSVFLLQSIFNWTNRGARVKLGTCDEPTVHEWLLIIAMKHNRSSSFYSEFRSDIIMKASSALIRREKRSRQEITFKGSDHRWEEHTGNTVVIFFNTFAEYVQSFSFCWSLQCNFNFV